jgi:cytochrome b6-f complex iron-sulfur subunit
MERKEFLSLLGLSTSSLVVGCLAGCSKNSANGGSTTGPSNVEFTIDLTQAAYSQLKNNGGYIYINSVLVARTLSGQYIAVQQVCTHENFSLVYQANYQRFYCDGHGGTFSESGAVTGGPPPRSLTRYNTTLNGNMLRVYS